MTPEWEDVLVTATDWVDKMGDPSSDDEACYLAEQRLQAAVAVLKNAAAHEGHEDATK